MLASLLIPLVALIAPAAVQPRPAVDLDADLAAIRRSLVVELEQLAEEAHGLKLFLQRDRVYAGLLEQDPDHKGARKALGFKRDRNGVWEQGRYRQPKDRGKDGAIEQFNQARAERTNAIRDRVVALVTAPEVIAARRERELRAWLLIDPEDPVLRAAIGQARGPDGGWMLADSAASLTRRIDLQERALDARAATPEARPWTPPGQVTRALALPIGLRNPVGRVAGTCEEQEARAALADLWVLTRVLDKGVLAPASAAALQRASAPRIRPQQLAWKASFAAYLIVDPGDLPQLLVGFPKISPGRRELMPKLATGWLEGATVLGVWGMGPAGRRDALARQIVGSWMRDHYRISTRQGWAWEGFGLYLGHLTTGTRLTFFVRDTRYVEQGSGPNFSERLREQGSDWYALLAELMATERPPKLAYLLGKDVNAMDERDMLLAHGLAAWLIEARPSEASAILNRLGLGHEPVRVLEEELGMRLPGIEAQLTRWAGEVAGQL